MHQSKTGDSASRARLQYIMHNGREHYIATADIATVGIAIVDVER